MLVLAAGVFLCLGIIGVLWMSREAAQRERLRLPFSRLSAGVPNLRYFPGWGRTDSEALTLARCSVESIQFTGDTDSPGVSLHITNKTGTSTQPTVEIVLYDVDGNRIGSCKPVEFWNCDFQPGEEKDMPESFSQLQSEPVFYAVSEPSLPVAAPAEQALSSAEVNQWMSDWLTYTDENFSGRTTNIEAYPHPGWVSITLHTDGYNHDQMQDLARKTAMNFRTRFPGQSADAHVWEGGHEETYRYYEGD